jgi:hypothetical protein
MHALINLQSKILLLYIYIYTNVFPLHTEQIHATIKKYAIMVMIATVYTT